MYGGIRAEWPSIGPYLAVDVCLSTELKKQGSYGSRFVL